MPPPAHVLVGEADRAVFLVSSCAVGAGAAVCVVCVRANGGGDNAAAVARYKCKLWVEVPSNDDNMAMMTSMVRSSDLAGGFPAADKGMLLWVPPEMLHGVPGGEAAILSIRIDRAAAATPKFTTTRARSQKGMH